MEKRNAEPKRRTGLFSPISADYEFSTGSISIGHITKLFYLCLLGILYVANSKLASKLDYMLIIVNEQNNELRVEYTNKQSEYMFRTKQSSVAKNVNIMGLLESQEPPRRLKEEEVVE